MKDNKSRILFTKTLSTDRALFRRGKEYEVDNAQAQEFISKGMATEAKPEKLRKVVDK